MTPYRFIDTMDIDFERRQINALSPVSVNHLQEAEALLLDYVLPVKAVVAPCILSMFDAQSIDHICQLDLIKYLTLMLLSQMMWILMAWIMSL